MKADYIVYTADTVPFNYSWDSGRPVDGSAGVTVSAYTTQNYISGYAPGVRVSFVNTSVQEPNYNYTNYTWDFGDYYNDEGNVVALSCLSIAEHIYIMPGKYTVSLNMTQTQTQEDTQPELVNPNDLICRGKDGVRWFWDNLTEDSPSLSSVCISWDESTCEALSSILDGEDYNKWWDDELQCFQKYCKLWSWEALKKDFVFYSPKIRPGEPIRDNPVRWKDTKDRQPFVKRWVYEANNKKCTLDIIDVVEDLEDAVSHVTVEVIEIPPVAGITCLTRPITGHSPFTVQLSPSACRCGSFPIDRIDWNFGDGSPTKTITRYLSLTSDPDFIFTNTYFNDQLDVRNFDVLHTYNVNRNTYPVFYPSLTCYSANTNTSDSCSTTVGPVLYSVSTEDLQLIKVKNTLKGVVYAFDVDKNIAFTTTTPTAVTSPTYNVPSNIVKDSIKEVLPSTTSVVRGYTGINTDEFQQETPYPEYITPTCNLSGVIAYNRLVTEDGNIPRPEAPEDGPNVPVNTEESFDIIP